jgi:hypothetical protein
MPVIHLLIRLIGYRRLKRALTRLVPLGSTRTGHFPEAGAVSRMVEAIARRCPTPSNCLSRSLTLWLLLRRHGADSEVCIGVRRDGHDLVGHAWVEYAGRPLNDTDGVREAFVLTEGVTPSA